MNLTIQTLFNDPAIVSAVIDRVQQTRMDTIYWRQYGDFRETKTRVFKTYLGTVTGVVAGSIIGKNDQKPLRERRSLGSGITEIAYLGDRYQMDNGILGNQRSTTLHNELSHRNMIKFVDNVFFHSVVQI